jgi:hypothetical protein
MVSRCMTPDPVGSGRNPMQSREGRRGRNGTLWRQDRGNGPGRGPTARVQGVSGPADEGENETGPSRPTGPGKIPPLCLNRPVPAALSQAGPAKTAAAKNRARFFQGMHPKSPNWADRLKVPQATVASFLIQLPGKSRNNYWQERKRRKGGRPLENNSSVLRRVSWSSRWAGKWLCPGTDPPQPRVGARWHGAKEKGVTDFSATPWH